MKKRILAVVLCIAMILSVNPFTLMASANEVDDTAKNILTVPDPGPDGLICFNNAGWDHPQGTGYYWGLGRWITTENANAKFYSQNSVDVNGENMFKVEVTAEVVGQATFHPATYELNVCFDAKESTVVEGGKHEGELYGIQPLSALYADAADYNYVAIRHKIVGDTATPTYFHVGASNPNDKKCDWKNVILVNYTDSTSTTITATGTTYNLPANFDGWIIVPESQFQSGIAMEGVTSVGFRYLSATNGKTFYTGDMKIVKDASAFLQAHAFPSFELTSDNTSVTVISTDDAAVYSLDKEAESWLDIIGINEALAELETDTKYTVYAKYVGSDKIVSREIWTAPYSTHKGDGASYLMNVYDDITKHPVLAYNTSIAGKRDIGWPSESATLGKNADGTYTGDNSYARLYLREIDGETFIELDRNEAIAETSCINQGINVNSITYNGALNGVNGATANDTGLHETIDTTNLSHFAIRVIIDELVEGAEQVSSFYLYFSGKNAQNLENAYLIEKATGNVIETDWTQSLSFTGEFDGWIVIPMNAYDTENGSVVGKTLITEQMSSVQPYMHGNDCHWNGESSWNNKILYLGDIVVFGDENLFKSVHVCGAAGHKGSGIATCTVEDTCTVCGQTFKDEDKHVNTEVRDAEPAECEKPGYTGDTWCLDCETKITTGEPIDALVHTGGEATCKDKAVCTICGEPYGEVNATNHKNTELRNYVKESCGVLGYTGDLWCNDCDTELEHGEPVDALVHTGGTATCKDKAICELCGEPYGEVDPEAHGDNTELKNAEPAECGKPGYTGDLWCNDCETVIEEGEPIEALVHTGGTATCKDKAVCTICGEPYGEVDATNHINTELRDDEPAECGKPGYTGDLWCNDCETVVEEGEPIEALVHTGGTATCKDKAICELCGEPYGEVDATNHINTELRDDEPAECEKPGYTGDTWCLDCETKIATGEPIEALVHTGGTATCKDKAICDICGEPYGEVDPEAHGTNTELRDDEPAECEKPGYTGDTWCLDCETKIATGEPIEALVHTGGTATCKDKAVCTICGEPYGEVDADAHGTNTEVRDAEPAKVGKAGYTGDTWCLDCETKIATGEPIDALVGGWVNDHGTWYYVKDNGQNATGWLKVGGVYYYFNANGSMKTGWLQEGSTWYYLKNSGAMATGWCNVGGVYYYFNASGAMKSNCWLQEGSTWYYLKNSGAMATGWCNVGGEYYYFSATGAMKTNCWVQDGSTWYYIKNSGVMAKGWLNLGGTWYYFNASGAMHTGWLNLNGTWYYMYASGAMATNVAMSGGYINANGVWKA